MTAVSELCVARMEEQARPKPRPLCFAHECTVGVDLELVSTAE
jgi:hypothetical protein